MTDNPIYKFLKSNNLTTKDEASFIKEYSNEGKAQELYGFLKDNKLTEKDFGSFYGEYFQKKDLGTGSGNGLSQLGSGSNPFQSSQVDTISPSPIYTDKQKSEQIGERFKFTPLSIPTEFGRVASAMKSAKKVKDTLPQVPEFNSSGSGMVVIPEGEKIGDSLRISSDFREEATDDLTNQKTGLQKQLDTAQGAFREAQGDDIANEAQNYQRPEETLKIKEELGFTESASRTGSNFVNRLQQFIPNTALSLGGTLETILGEDIGGDFYAQITQGGDIDNHRREAFAKLDELKPAMEYTKGFIESGKDFDIPGLIAAAVDATSSLLSTVITSAPTAGLGLYSDMVGGGVYDYNTTKANRLGLSVEELYKTGKNEFVVPAMLQGFAARLESIGLKGIKDGILANVKKGAGQRFALIAHGANREGFTEFLQTGVDAAQGALSEGKNPLQAGEVAVSTMFSKKGAESYLMGLVASGAAITGGRIIKGMMTPKAKKQVSESVDSINQMQQELNNPNISEESKAFIVDAIQDNVKKVVDAVDEDVDVTEKLGAEQTREVQELNKNIAFTERVSNDQSVSEEVRQLAKDRLEVLNKKLDDKLNETPKKTKLDEEIKEPVDTKTVISGMGVEPVVSDQNSTVVSAVIEIGGKIYEGKNHAEAILKAKADGQDISQVNRQAQGKFKLSDGTIIDRAESKKRFGQDRSELMIEQDEVADNANKEYRKITDAKTDVATQEQVSPQIDTNAGNVKSEPKGKTLFIPNVQIGSNLYAKDSHVEGASLWEIEDNGDGTVSVYPNRNTENQGTILNNRESELIPLFSEGNSYNPNAKKLIATKPAKLRIVDGKVTEIIEQGVINYDKIPEQKTVTNEQVEVSPQEETIVSKPKIVVHATEGDAGFALSQFEGVDTKDIVTPDEDYRNSAEFKNGKTLLVDSTVDDSGAINVRIAAGMSDVGGRAGSAVYDIVIPKGSTATTQVINDIIQSEHNKPREKGDRSLIKRTTKLIKEYIDSRQPETKTNEQETQTKGEDKRPVTATGSDTAVTEEVGSGVVVDKTPEQNITDISKETGLQFTKSKNSNSWYSSDGNKKIRISDHPSKFVEKSKEFNGDDAIDLDYNYYSKDAIVHLIKGTNPFENYKIGDKIIHSNNKIGEVEYLNSDYKKGYVEVLTQDGRTVKYDTGKFLSKENNLQNPKQSLPTQEVAPPKLSLDFIDEVKIPKNGIKRDILGTRGKNKGKVIDTEIVSKDDLIKEHNAIREKENKLKKLIACLTK